MLFRSSARQRFHRSFVLLAMCCCVMSLSSIGPVASASVVSTYVDDHAGFYLPLGVTGTRHWSQVVTVQATNESMFFSNAFGVTNDPAFVGWGSTPSGWQGGYMGIQTDGYIRQGNSEVQVPKAVLFSLWGATSGTGPLSDTCTDWIDPNNTVEGGFGISCRVAWDWQVGVPIKFALNAVGNETGLDRHPDAPTALIGGAPVTVPGTTWAVTAQQGTSTIEVARIFMPGTTHQVTGVTNFAEYFGGNNRRCFEPDYFVAAQFSAPTYDGVSTTQRFGTGPNTATVCDVKAEWDSDASTTISVKSQPNLGAITGFSPVGRDQLATLRIQGTLTIPTGPVQIRVRELVASRELRQIIGSPITVARPDAGFDLTIPFVTAQGFCLEALRPGDRWRTFSCDSAFPLAFGEITRSTETTSNFELNGFAKVNGFGGLIGVYARLNGSNVLFNGSDLGYTKPDGSFSFSIPVPNPRPANNEVCILANSNGRVATIGCHTFTAAVADTSAPTVSVSTPTLGQVLASSPVTLAGTATDNIGVSTVRVTIYRSVAGGQYWNGAGWQNGATTVPATLRSPGSASTTWTYTFDAPPGGVFTTTAFVYDAANNYGLGGNRTFSIVDTAVPTVSVASPTPGQSFLGGAVTVTGSATDNAGIGEVQVVIYRPIDPTGQYWNGTAWQASYTTLPATVMSPGESNTTYTYRFEPPQTGASFYVAVIALDTSNQYKLTPFIGFTVSDATPSTQREVPAQN
jgi:Bacterial Ig domain